MTIQTTEWVFNWMKAIKWILVINLDEIKQSNVNYITLYLIKLTSFNGLI